ncbi:MAG: hypothetical protein JSR82_04420 [Verrucomicrobia bacterium]|nr:hypothetical protein [Verrucomicrobiota bacterium]
MTSGSASPDIVLSPGINTVFIDVYAEDLALLESYIVTVTQLTSYPDWRLTYFGILENSGTTEDTASYVGDGIPNLPSTRWA